jgi:two-component system cell cycle sensor histidine kinase PleC
MTYSRVRSTLIAWFDPQDAATLELRRDQLAMAVAITRGGPLQLVCVIAAVAAVALQWHDAWTVGSWAVFAISTIAISRLVARGIARRLAAGTGSFRRLNTTYLLVCLLALLSIAASGPLFWVGSDAGNHFFLLLLLTVSATIGVAQQAIYPPAAALVAFYLATAIGLCLWERTAPYLLMVALALTVAVMLTGVTIRATRSAETMLRLRQSERAMLKLHEDMVRDLRDANEAKSDFLARMSHELRTPLNAVIGFSDVMLQQSMGPVGTPVYLDYLKHIHSSGAHLLELINDILDLSKLEAGRFDLREGIVDLWEVVQGAIAMVHLRAESGGVTLVNAIRPGITLHADETAVRQIALNLVTNAIKFTPPGGEVTWSAVRAANGDVVVTVRDSGVGIRPEDIERVFEAFGQSQSGFGAQERGTGLGLPIVRTLMQLHGGEASLESVLGEGTTVALRFPAARIVETPDRIAA